jgi:2',3'-cyclic-nucleotide 2'-phosphodiesterase (5'-nucleotidase family)
MRVLYLSFLFLLIGAPAAAQPAAPTSQPAAPTSQPGASEEGRLHVLFTTDIYGRFAWPGCGKRPTDKADLSHLVAAVKRKREQLRKAGEGEPLVLAGGSMLRPDVLGNHIFGEGKAWSGSAIKLLKKVGFHGVSVGPYDFGAQTATLEHYLSSMRAAGIPLLAGNVTCEEKGDFRCKHLGDGKGRRYLVLQRGALRVGVLSLTREDMPTRILKRSRGSMSADDPLKTARKLIRLLRKQEQAHVVIVLATLNLESDAPAPVLAFVRELGPDAPDLVVADSMFHRGSDDFIARIQSKLGSAIVGTDRFGQHLGHAVVHYRKSASGVTVPKIEVKVEPVAGVTPDKYDAPLVTDMLRELCRGVDRPLGQAAFTGPMKHTDFTSYVMEIMRNREGAELTFLNDSSLADTSFNKGPLTREGVLRAIRTETPLGSIWVTGATLKKLLLPFILGRKSGLRWHGLKKDGLKWYVNKRLLIDGLHYRVATTRFVATGGDSLIKLRTQPFHSSGFTLRRAVLDFFSQGGPARVDQDPTIDLDKDFPDPWKNWVLYAGSEFGFYVSNLSVGNSSKYNQPSLTKDNIAALTLDADLSLGASNRNHAIEADIGLKYGMTWTLTSEDEAAGKDRTELEAHDKIRVDFLYRLNLLRNLEAPSKWYMPVPYAEATLITEFTGDNEYTDALTSETETYRYIDLGGTVGVGLLPHPYLFIKMGFAFGGELGLPPQERVQGIDEEMEKRYEGRTGVYLGYKLRRFKLVADPRHPLQLESRLDFFMTNLGSTFRKELTLGTKLYFSLTRFLNVVASHDLYVYDTQCTAPASKCIKGANDTSVANAVSLGLNFLFDYRHQLF